MKSHPVWDEWIEILILIQRQTNQQRAHPAWDEWIEIGNFAIACANTKRLIPLGMSGLK